MAGSASVLLLDDGELDDVREMLVSLGAEVQHLRGGAIPDTIDPPEDLFIATSRRAMIADAWPPALAGTGPVKIGIVTEDSNTLRNMLRRIGFQLLVRRPVHPYALRLLLLRALYAGDEKRREQRIAIGCEVSYRAGLRRRTATLADLSLRGCRLLSSRLLPVGSRVNLQLPKELGGKPLQLRAKVIRAIDGGHGARRGEYTIGLIFDGISVDLRKQLAEVLKARAAGPAVLSEEVAKALAAATDAEAGATTDADETPVAGPGSEADRRKHRRGSFVREVIQLDEEASRVLVGRDLSVGGMQVDATEDLEPGSSMRLAIYGAPREEPFVVTARVVRNTEDGGTALEFEQLPPAVAKRLEALVSHLPGVESLDDGEIGSLNTVVTQIIE